jgi:hypothetical protein
VKVPNEKFHGDLACESRSVIGGEADRRTDGHAKLIGAFLQYAHKFKDELSESGFSSVIT